MLKKRDWVYEEGKGGEVILVRLLQSNQHSAHRVFVTYIHALFDAQISQGHSICALYKCLMLRIASLNMFSSAAPVSVHQCSVLALQALIKQRYIWCDAAAAIKWEPTGDKKQQPGKFWRGGQCRAVCESAGG